jgi:hypothetical protein
LELRQNIFLSPLGKAPAAAYNGYRFAKGRARVRGFLLLPKILKIKETTMMLRRVLLGACVLSLVTLAAAQTKVSGSAQCTKPDIQQKVDVPDHPGHTFSVSQFKCTWSKPMEVAGIQDKDGVDTGLGELHGDAGTSHGYYVDTFANGDKTYVHWQGTDSMKDGTSQGKWIYSGGTGKFKGLKGSGTYKGKYAQDGTVSFDVEGDYTLPKM